MRPHWQTHVSTMSVRCQHHVSTTQACRSTQGEAGVERGVVLFSRGSTGAVLHLDGTGTSLPSRGSEMLKGDRPAGSWYPHHLIRQPQHFLSPKRDRHVIFPTYLDEYGASRAKLGCCYYCLRVTGQLCFEARRFHRMAATRCNTTYHGESRCIQTRSYSRCPRLHGYRYRLWPRIEIHMRGLNCPMMYEHRYVLWPSLLMSMIWAPAKGASLDSCCLCVFMLAKGEISLSTVSLEGGGHCSRR